MDSLQEHLKHNLFLWSNLVPVVFAVPVEGWEHDGEDGGGIVAYQAHDIPANLLSDINLAIYILALQAQLILLL